MKQTNKCAMSIAWSRLFLFFADVLVRFIGFFYFRRDVAEKYCSYVPFSPFFGFDQYESSLTSKIPKIT